MCIYCNSKFLISIIFIQQPHSRDQRDLRYEGISNPCSWGCVTPVLYFPERESLVYDFLGKNLYLQSHHVFFVFWGLQQQLTEHSTFPKFRLSHSSCAGDVDYVLGKISFHFMLLLVLFSGHRCCSFSSLFCLPCSGVPKQVK